MKTAVCYATKTGTTEKCANRLKELLPEADLFNIEKDSPDLSKYDCIVIGGSIRMGHLHRAAKKLIQGNKSLLMTKKYAFFICNGFPEQAENFFLQNIDKDLLEHSLCVSSFGGEVDLGKMKGMDKFIAKAVMNTIKNPEERPQINENTIEEFAKIVNGGN